MKCKICDCELEYIFTEKILDKFCIKYFKCNHCEFLCTEEPYWLDEAYSSAITNSDTGILQRNLGFSKEVPILLKALNCDLSISKFLDFAGGGGIFVRLMRDLGIDFYWYDKYCENWVANGFEGDLSKKYSGITAFECFEHFINPKQEIEKLFQYSDNIIFSTIILPQKIPDKSWWYFAFREGQHVSFYSYKTLEYIAKENKFNFYSFGNTHCFTKVKINYLTLHLIRFIIKHVKIKSLYFYLIKNKLKSKTILDMNFIRQKNDI